MGLDLSGLTDYSWADIKKAAKAAMVNGALGGTTLTVNGKSIGRITPLQARQLYEFAEQMENASSSDGAGIALVQFREPQ